MKPALPSPEHPQIAVCLHGFLRTGASMLPMSWRLQRAGYTEVRCPTFQLALGTVEEHGARAAALITELSARHNGAPVDVVTHSMGGLVLRASLAHSPPIRRVVMLAPPNQGAEAAAKMRGWLPLHRLGWDPLQPLLPANPSALPVPSQGVEVGILTGGVGSDAGYTSLLSGDNDGKVRVEEAHLPGAADFQVVPFRHPLIMAWQAVFELVLRFLETGAFRAPAGDEGQAPPSAPT